jgi:membrane-associated phospholipid phosphatase
MYNGAVTYLPWHLSGLVFVLVGLILGCTMPPVGGNSEIHQFARFASNLFNTLFLTLGILTLLVLAYLRRSKAEFLRLTSVMLTETAIVQIIQKTSFYAFGVWARPSGKDGGFPSGHAAASCALAFLLTERLPKGAPLWYACAALITWSRVEAGAHYPYQIVCGAILGLGVAGVFARRTPLPSPEMKTEEEKEAVPVPAPPSATESAPTVPSVEEA